MSDLRLVEAVRRREAARLESRVVALSREFSELRRKFEQAERLRPELEERIKGDELFLTRFNQFELQEWLGAIRQELIELFAESDQLVLRYESTTGRCRLERSGHTLESTARLLDELLAKEERSGSVSYPIIFSHEEEMNREALVASLNFGLLVASFGGQDAGASLSLKYQGEEVIVDRRRKAQLEDVPPANRFGFVKRGESFRQLEEFIQADASAHWEHWVGDATLPQRGELVLREQGGALLKILIDGDNLLVREEYRPRTELIRKRTNLFAEAQSFRCHDRYFTSLRALEDRLRISLQKRVRAGFRIVYRADDEGQPRGTRPA